MLNRESVPQQVAEKLGAGESVQVVSPASLDIMGQIPVQGFAALTNGYIVFLQESGLSGLQVTPYPRNQLNFKGIAFGIIGKTYVFDSGGSEIKFGGLEMPFETALGNAYPQAVQEEAPTTAAPSIPPPPTPAQIRASVARTPPPPPPPPAATRQTSQRFPPPDQTPYQVTPTPSRGPILAVAIMAVIIMALGIVGWLFMSSMKSGAKKEAAVDTASIPAKVEDTSSTATSSSAGKSERITVTVGGGTELIGIRKKESGKYKVAIGGQPFKGKVEPDRIKISTESGPTVIKVKVKDDGFKVTDGQDKLIAKVKPDGSGYKISGETAVIARVKSKGKGFTVTGDGTTKLGSVEPDGDGWKVLNETGTKLYSVKGSSGKAAAMLLALKDNVLAQAGVLVYLNEF